MSSIHLPAVASVRISGVGGRVSVTAEQRSDIEVDAAAEVAASTDHLTVATGSGRVALRVPVGTDVVIGTRSGRVQVSGPVGAVAIATVSGRVEVERAASIDVRSRSGRITVGDVEGDCRIQARSARVEVASTGGLAEVATSTGRIQLHRCGAAVHTHCVSGRIAVEMATAANVHAETVSGRISVTLPRGTRPLRADGDPPADGVPSGYDCVVSVRSTRGRVTVTTR